MPLTEFPAPPDLKLNYEQTITDGININLNPWTVENPHPNFGKDPNILNEYGHTEYPMWVDNPNKNSTEKRVIVQNKAEYEELVKAATPTEAAPAWPK